MRPHGRRVASAIAASVVSLATSASNAMQSPAAAPDCRAIATVSSAEARTLSTASTLAPSSTKRSTVARPLPMPSPGDWPAPTTMATLSLRRMENLDHPANSHVNSAAGNLVYSIDVSQCCDQPPRYERILHQDGCNSKRARSQHVTAKTAFYASVGPELSLFDVDVAAATLEKRGTTILPANVQYAWQQPSTGYLYVVSSAGGRGVSGTTHRANAFRIDPVSGALEPHGDPQSLPSRPIHTSVDASSEYLLTPYNHPSNVTVHHINGDGSSGEAVRQPRNPDTGPCGPQTPPTPRNRTAPLLTRRNHPTRPKHQEPCAPDVATLHRAPRSPRAA